MCHLVLFIVFVGIYSQLSLGSWVGLRADLNKESTGYTGIHCMISNLETDPVVVTEKSEVHMVEDGYCYEYTTNWGAVLDTSREIAYFIVGVNNITTQQLASLRLQSWEYKDTPRFLNEVTLDIGSGDRPVGLYFSEKMNTLFTILYGGMFGDNTVASINHKTGELKTLIKLDDVDGSNGLFGWLESSQSIIYEDGDGSIGIANVETLAHESYDLKITLTRVACLPADKCYTIGFDRHDGTNYIYEIFDVDGKANAKWKSVNQSSLSYPFSKKFDSSSLSVISVGTKKEVAFVYGDLSWYSNTVNMVFVERPLEVVVSHEVENIDDIPMAEMGYLANSNV